MDKQDKWTDEGPGEDPTLRRKQQFGQCLGNAEQASSSAGATARLSATRNCPESGLGWNLSLATTSNAGQQSWDSHPWCSCGNWQVMQRQALGL